MPPKIFCRLIIIIVILIVAIFYQNTLIKNRYEKNQYTSTISLFDKDKVDDIYIWRGASKDETLVHLKRLNSNWKIPSYYDRPIDLGRFEKGFNYLATLEGELRTSGERHFDHFMISDELGFHIEIMGRDIKHHLVIGALKTEASSSFVRKYKSDRIYYVDQDLLSLLGIVGEREKAILTKAYFADMRLLSFNIEDVKQIQLTNLNFSKAISPTNITKKIDDKGHAEWKFARSSNQAPINQNSVREYLRGLLSVYGHKLRRFESDIDYGLDKTTWELSLSLKDGITYSILAGQANVPDSHLRYVQLNGSELLYGLSQENFDKLDKDFKEFAINLENENNPAFAQDFIADITAG